MNRINMTFEELCQTAPIEEPARQQFFIARCRELLEAEKSDSGSGSRTFHIETFGCPTV